MTSVTVGKGKCVKTGGMWEQGTKEWDQGSEGWDQGSQASTLLESNAGIRNLSTKMLSVLKKTFPLRPC